MEFHPHNLGVIICSHIFEQTKPVLLVVRDKEGWNFACGGTDHRDDDFHNVGVGHLTDRDPSLDACSDLPVGFAAERLSPTLPWTRAALTADEP